MPTIKVKGLNVLIAPDKFKGTLTAPQAAAAIARGWKAARPQDRLELLPITDGGDGFGRVMSGLWRARTKKTRTVDAAGRKLTASWWWNAERNTAIIESAEVIGLAKLPPGRFHPFELDTSGLAAVIRAVSRAGAKRCLVGIGGSATNDAGFGVAGALGWQFLDRAGEPIDCWARLHRLHHIKPGDERLNIGELIVAVDVRNPLLGKAGATRIYGPQKGLRRSDFPKAEAALDQFARVTHRHFSRAFGKLPGAGAAGGLGFGLAAFFGARLESGFDLFARESRLRQKIKAADLVITGEGQIDRSTVMGKGVGELARICKASGVRCIALSGDLDIAKKPTAFTRVAALTSITSVKQSRTRAAYWLEKLARSVAESINPR